MDDEELNAGLLEEFHDAEDALSNTCRESKKSAATKALKMEILTEKFAERGLKLRKGRWTVQEKKRLNDNFVDFVHQYEEEIGDPTDFATKSENKSRAWEVRRLKLQLGFLRALCKGLFRDQHTVSQHSKHVLDPLCISNGQKYAVEDLHRLKCLVDLHGHNWKEIAKLTGRSIYSCQSAYRNFFLHDEYERKPPTRKQQRKLIKEMGKLFPEKDLLTELLHDVPWNDIANKIGFMHGKYLHTFWESNVKYQDEDGKIRFKKPGKLPVKLVRKFIKYAASQSPTHLDALDWDKCFKMFTGYLPGIVMMKAIIRQMTRAYKINWPAISLSEALVQLRQVMKQQKKLGFQSIWQEIKREAIEVIRWQQYHWALSPDVAHYVQNRPVMYWGYAEDHAEDIKPDIVESDPDIVW